MTDTTGGNGDRADAVDALLREFARGEAHIDDAGFTASVMSRLPGRANFAWRRRILRGFGALAAICGLLGFGGAAYIWDAALELASGHRFGTAQLSVLVFALTLTWGLYTALSAEREQGLA